MDGFAFPNDVYPPWSIMIVIYPYLTGLVAGAFVVSSLYHVFHVNALQPVARLSLVTATCFCACAGLPLQLHLHHPENSYLIFVTPSTTSAMVMFGAIYNAYLLLLFIEMWFEFRPTIVERANTSSGIVKLVYRTLALGVTEISERARATDASIIRVLSFVGIPAACLLHGYVGFLFGAVKANPWWSTALMPVIFLLSAAVSGIAALIVLYVLISRMRGQTADTACVRTLVRYLWGFLIIAISLEGLELIHMRYEGSKTWPILDRLLSDQLHVSHFWVQTVIGSAVPFVLLPVALLSRTSAGTIRVVAVVGSLLALVQVLAMRWNVVVGGQLYSKSLRGFVEYPLHWAGREGLIAGGLVMCLPLVLIFIAIKLLPLHMQTANSE